jgi:NADP-dependent 3-hydroxy acid dehydrogenase YdfG
MKLVKTVLITGATSGIGKATAKIFAKNGYRLIITGRRQEKIKELQDKLTSKYKTEILPLVFDIRSSKAVEKAIIEMAQEWKDIDVLVNNAGLAKGFHSIFEGKIEDWETMIDTNVKGLLYITRLVSPWMVAKKKGHIINICSTAGHEVYPKGNVYSATKYAVNALTKSFRLDLYTHGIKVSQVSPGHVEDTEFALVRFEGDENRAKIYDDFTPLHANDVAETIFFIATRPKHVNIQDVLMMGKQQASSNFIDRSGRLD